MKSVQLSPEKSRLERLLAYEGYVQGPIWGEKRRKVLERCRGICEGCGERKATQVHHLQYPVGCMPGSVEWVEREKLYNLVGLCERCHGEVHDGWKR